MEKYIYILLAIFVLLAIKYLFITTNNKRDTRGVKNKNIIRYSPNNVIPFIIVIIFMSVVLFILNIFWKTNSIDKFVVILIFLPFIIFFNAFIVYLLNWKIEIKENSFVHYNFLKIKKEYFLKGLYICFKKGKTSLYDINKKVLSIPIYVVNVQVLIDKIIKNNHEAIIPNINYLKKKN